MGFRSLTARKLCVTVIALIFACAAAFAFLFAPTTAIKAEESSTVPNIELGAIGVTYIIGDDSVNNLIGAEEVNGNAEEYGWYVYSEANNTYRYTRLDMGWAAAMSAVTSANNRVRVVLASDWIAQPTEREVSNNKLLYTSFGADEKVFPYGRLEIPQGMYMQLDLNGNVLDRGLDCQGNGLDYQGNEYSSVIYGKNCELEIIDGDPTKTHEGRYDYEKTVNAEDGQVQNQTVNVNGGIIAGAYVSDSATIGAVYMESAKLLLRGGTITKNGTNPSGGYILCSGIYAKNTEFVMLGGNIVNNSSPSQAGTSGGGVYVSNFSIFYMYNGKISDNRTDCYGGGVSVSDASNFVMYGGEISANRAKSRGDGVYLNKGSDMIISGGKVCGNPSVRKSGNNGGGVGVYSSTLTITGGEIFDNMSGGIDVMDSDVTISGGEIYNNESQTDGGGLYATNSDVTISGGRIYGNTAKQRGGGIYTEKNSFTVTGGEITGNTAVQESAGVLCDSDKINFGGNPVIKNNTVTGQSNGDRHNFVLGYGKRINFISKMEDDAEVFITCQTVFAYSENQSYIKYHNVNGVPLDPNKYFESSSETKTILLLDSELCDLSGAPQKITFKTAYASTPAELTETTGYYGAWYDYAKDSKIQYELTIDAENQTPKEISKQDFDGTYVAYTGDITDAGHYKITYGINIGGKEYNLDYYITILPQDITSEAVTALSESKYEYDGTVKEPSVTVTYNGTALTANKDYEITYKNNIDAGTGYAVINFKGNYTGKKELPFEINITGGQYNVAWEYYDGTAWTEVTEQTKFEYIPGYRGNQTNKVRAKLTLKGAAAHGDVIKYAYADGVTEYNDPAVSATNISEITVKYTYNAETVAAFRNAGEYTVWLNGESDYPIGGKHETPLNITKYEIKETDERLTVRITDGNQEYDGSLKRPTVKVVLDYLVLYEGIDYEVTYSDETHEDQAINGGAAKAKITFIGNYSGTTEIGFEITTAENSWEKMPNIVRWTYGNFDTEKTVIIAQPKYLLPEKNVHISILTGNGETIEGLEDIATERVVDNTYGECYKITNETIISKLNELPVNRYTLRVWVDGTSSYTELGNEEIVFNVLRAENYWEESPSIESWITGEYDATKNTPESKSKYGQDNVVITITNETGEYVYYDSSKEINLLSSMGVGLYIMTAEVKGTDNYTGLKYTNTFRVFDIEGTTVIVEEGMPWWGVLLIVVGVIAIIVAVMVILHVKGVLQLITGKMVIKMRAKADVDATIAAIKAGRMAAAATTATATTTEDNEKKTEKKAKALEKKAKTPEEKAAELEAKAKAMRKKAEAMKAKAKVIVMTPEEKKAMKAEERAKEKEKTRVKSPEEKAEALEKKAEANEMQAEQLKARAEVMKNRANEMREKAQKRKEKQQNKPTQQEEA